MAELQEGRYTGEFVVSEGNGSTLGSHSPRAITVLSGETRRAFFFRDAAAC